MEGTLNASEFATVTTESTSWRNCDLKVGRTLETEMLSNLPILESVELGVGAVQEPIGKLSGLRQAARLGDGAAATLLLNHALTHKQIAVTAVWQADLLVIHLTSPGGDAQIWLTLACRELQEWHLPAQTLICVDHLPLDSPTPDWQKTLSAGELVQFAQARHRPLPMHRNADFLGNALPTVAMLPTRLQVQAFDREAMKAIGAGALLALLVLLSGQVTFYLSYFVILVHELGHTALSWLFGFPALPAFDFMNGGGVSVSANDRYFAIVWLVYGGLGWLGYRYRRNKLTVQVLVAVGVIYSLCAFSHVHQLLQTAMGHGFELIFAGMFCYRGLSGFACRYSIERPLYVMLGLFTVVYDLRFCWNLLFDPVTLSIYLEGKGGVIDNDLVRVARDHLHVNLAVVVWLFLLLVLATPLITAGLYRYRQWMIAAFLRMFAVLQD